MLLFYYCKEDTRYLDSDNERLVIYLLIKLIGKFSLPRQVPSLT